MKCGIAPCESCPYVLTTPPGVWDESEYRKLPEWDKPTGEQPPLMFACHHQNGLLCAGWVHVHDMDNNLALRLAVAYGHLTPGEADEVREYTSPKPCYRTGQEACDAGIRDPEDLDAEAERVIQKIEALQERIKA